MLHALRYASFILFDQTASNEPHKNCCGHSYLFVRHLVRFTFVSDQSRDIVDPNVHAGLLDKLRVFRMTVPKNRN